MPNVHNKRFFSDVLEDFVRVKVSTKALKTIKKVRVRLLQEDQAYHFCGMYWSGRTLALTI